MRAKFVFERSYDNFKIDDIINNKFIELQGEKDFLGPYVSQYMHEEHNEFFEIWEDSSDIEESNDFKEWLIYELEYRYEKLRDLFLSLIDNGYITLYRSMMVQEDYLNKMEAGQIKRLGIFWTYDIESAEPHWGYDKDNRSKEIILEIKINEEYINWVETYRLGLEHEFMNEEKEMRLFKNTPIDIQNIIFDGKEVDLKDIKKFNYIA